MLVVVLLAPWAVGGALFLGGKSTRHGGGKTPIHLEVAGSRVTQARHGPWGDIEMTRIAIEPPEEFIFVTDEPQNPPNWFFRNHTRDAVISLFRGAQLSPEQLAALLNATLWEVTAEGVRIRPTADLVLGLSLVARERIYNELALSPDNQPQNAAYSFNPAHLAERLESSGLSVATVKLFESLLYRHGNLLLFADSSVVLPRLPDVGERVRFLKMLARMNTLLATLRINENTDVEKLAGYWGFDGRAKDLRPLLESLRRVPGGANLDLVHLLPPFARRYMYNYPVPSNEPARGRRDGLWTSLNFFNEVPDDRFVDPKVAINAISANYYPIASGAQLGDLMVVLTHDDHVIQTATYVADDVVFTKNGSVSTQPWMLQRLGDLMEYYATFFAPNEPLKVRIFRAKELSPALHSSE